MRHETRTDWHRRVDQTVRRLHASLDDPIGFAELAAEVSSSPYHFHRMFRALTGETAAQCLRRLRLERAAARIGASGHITDIALEAGFETSEAFSRAFKKQFGIRPSVLRTMQTWNGLLPSRAGIHYGPEGSKGWFFIGEVENHMDVKIVSLPPRRVYAMRNIGDYWQLPECWQRFVKALEAGGYHMPLTTGMLVFHDHGDDTPMETRRSDVTALADCEIALAGDLFVEETPGGLYAITPHFGSFEEIGQTWDRWRKEWLPVSGWTMDTSRPSLEWYQNDPSTMPPELLLTLLCDPVIRA